MGFALLSPSYGIWLFDRAPPVRMRAGHPWSK
jgi:hypothetical protein